MPGYLVHLLILMTEYYTVLTKHYFSEIIIIVLDSAVTQFHQVLPSVCNPKLKLDFVTIPDDADMGTADALRYIKDKIEVSIKFMVQIYCTNTVNNISMYVRLCNITVTYRY